MVKETTRQRLDQYILEQGLVDSRSKARALIMTGCVNVDGKPVDKPGTKIKPGSEIEIKQKSPKYVSRGGCKLEAALNEFNINAQGTIAIDIGASTGGFTDCLLQHGAKKVYALDVGYGQLDWNLRNDDRVIVKERINCRYLKPEDIGELVDLVVIDVSFISLTKVIKPALANLKKEGILIALIKPQFEVGKGKVGRGGIVVEHDKHVEMIDKIKEHLTTLNFETQGVIQSPILGAEGNKEFLICARPK